MGELQYVQKTLTSELVYALGMGNMNSETLGHVHVCIMYVVQEV
jgi:hypothetical protein